MLTNSLLKCRSLQGFMVCLVLAAGCRGPAKESELWGHWVRTDQASGITSELIFNPDGSFTAHDVPRRLVYIDDIEPKFISGVGRWQVSGYSWIKLILKTTALWDRVWLDFSQVTGAQGSYRTEIMIADTGSKRHLFYWGVEPGIGRVEFRLKDSKEKEQRQ